MNPAILNSVETRFVGSFNDGKVMMQKKVFKALAKDDLFLEWIVKESKKIRLEVQALVCMTLLFSCVFSDSISRTSYSHIL